MRAQQDGAQCGAESERVECGNQRGDGNGQCELFVKLSGEAAYERDRDEHGTQDQGDSHDRLAYFFHRLVGSLARTQAELDISFHIFDHHDGIIDDNADRQH